MILKTIKIFMFVLFIFVAAVYSQQKEWIIELDKPLGSFMVHQLGFNGKQILKPDFEPSSKSNRIQIKQLQTSIKIDGKLNEKAWSNGELIGSFFNKNTNENAIDSTNVNILFDEKNIYIGVTCNKSYEKETIDKCSQRDTPVMLDDHVGIYITPMKMENEKHFYKGYYYFIAVNPSGTIFDAFFNPWHGGIFYSNWNPDIKAAANQENESWTVEMVLSFNGLEYYVPPGREYLFNFTRKLFDTNRIQSSYAPRGVIVKNTHESMVPWRIPFYDSRFIPLSEYCPKGLEFKRPKMTLKRAIKTKNNRIDWTRAVTVNDLLRHDTGKLPNQRTSVQVTYDENNLYTRFICYESLMDELIALNKEHDWPEWNEWGSYRSPKKYRVEDDAVGLYLCPGFDEFDQYHHPYYLIMVNAEGIVYDAFFDEFGIFYKSWDSGVESKIIKEKDHWIAELTIPFSHF